MSAIRDVCSEGVAMSGWLSSFFNIVCLRKSISAAVTMASEFEQSETKEHVSQCRGGGREGGGNANILTVPHT